jgi:predicted Zn-dependent peptidase
MRTHRISRIVPVLAAAALAACVVLPAFAQSPPAVEDQERFKSQGRGDVHSPGYAEAMKLKGSPVAPKFPEVGKEIERKVLPNGLAVYLAEDHRLPLVQVELAFRGGSYFETPEDAGVARIAGQQMRDGGTEAMAPDEIDDRLGFLAANVSTEIGDQSGSASLDVLAKNFDAALPLFADVVLRPRFDEQRLEIAKRRQVFALTHQNDNPADVLSRELATLLYGDKHPRGRQMTPDLVRAINRDRIRQAHGRYVRPNQAFLTVVGDFDSKEMLAKLTAAFGEWEKGSKLATKDLPKADRTPKPGVYLVDRPLNQSNIAVAHLGVSRDDPDRYAIDLMNDVLGGGSFSSRITERVRSDEGLAYSAGSRFNTADRDLGTFQATVQTKTESTTKAISLILDEVAKIRKPGSLSRNEFETASESRLFSQVFRFENLSGNVSRLMRYEMDGLPADQDRRNFDGWKAVTPKTIEAAAQKHLRSKDLTIFVVGDAKQLAEPLKAFGEVRLVPLKEFPSEPMRRPGR